MNALPQEKPHRITWDDYCRMPDEPRVEIIDGRIYAMAAPTVRHQHIVSELCFQLRKHFHGKPCIPFVSPIDVKLSEEDVVQPDVIVVCDKKQIRETHIEGPPALVVEVLSRSSQFVDRARKHPLYAAAGVAEYWVVTPYPAMVEVFRRKGEDLTLAAAFDREGEFRSPQFPDLRIDLKSVFNYGAEPGEELPLILRASKPLYARQPV